jgi:uncharacterized protein
MRTLIFSDSHGYTHNMIKAINKHKNIDMIIHLGDIIKDAVKIEELYKTVKVMYVPGNNDFAVGYSKEKLFDIEGKKVFITHGHNYNVKNGYQSLISKGKSINADVIFFGHTHLTEEIYKEGMLIINPGSISIPVKPNCPTYCIAEFAEGRIFTNFFNPLAGSE